MASRTALIFTLSARLTIMASAQQNFLSNPAITPPTINVQTNVQNLTAPGYIFAAPFFYSQPGPVIYAQDGSLVWDGSAYTVPLNGHDFNVCSVNGTDHLCFIDAFQENGYARGNGLILDNTYNLVETVHSGNGAPLLDQHEFFVQPSGKTVLATIYNQVADDTASQGIPGVTNVTEGMFQEIDLDTGAVIFEWHSLKWVPVNESYVLPNTTDISGAGNSISGWDYFHINSVDKDSQGNYLISARHTSAIYYLSGQDGHIIWTLGGKSSSFAVDYTFSFQHHARFRGGNSTSTIISLYDDGSDDAPPPPGTTKPGYEAYSSGLVITVNTATGTSTLLERYVSPELQLSQSQGSFQYLPNNNKFMGMGNVPYMIEFTSNATGNAQVVYYANFTQGESYRMFKFPWKGQPTTPPSVFSYAHNCSAQTAVYASWNGATEVASWRISTSYAANGRYLSVLEAPKVGFETQIIIPKSLPYVIAEALSANGTVLGTSQSTGTFVPAASLAGDCSDVACAPGTNYSTAGTTACPNKLRTMHILRSRDVFDPYSQRK